MVDQHPYIFESAHSRFQGVPKSEPCFTNILFQFAEDSLKYDIQIYFQSITYQANCSVH